MARTIELGPLYQAIEELQDDSLILKLYELLGIAHEDHVRSLSEAERKDIQKGFEDFEQNRFSSHAEVDTRVKKWLRGK